MGWSRRLWSSVAGVQVVGGVGAPVDVSKGAEPGVLVGASPVPPEGQTDGGQSVTGGSRGGELMCPAGRCPPPSPCWTWTEPPFPEWGEGRSARDLSLPPLAPALEDTAMTCVNC